MRTPSSIVEFMKQAARGAAAGLMRDFAELGSVNVSEKLPADFVSSADLRSEAFLRAELSAAYPDHDLVMEESAATRGATESLRPRFLVDPLDGTTNFLHGIPHFAISIAREEKGGVTDAVVYDASRDEMFWAEAGYGAFLGARRLTVSSAQDLSRAVVGTGIPHRAGRDHARYLESLAPVMREVAGIRRFGSAALDLAYVSAGRFEAFFEKGLAPWDVAAGALLVREAGGCVTRIDGRPAGLADGDIFASCGEPLHDALRRLMDSSEENRRTDPDFPPRSAP